MPTISAAKLRSRQAGAAPNPWKRSPVAQRGALGGTNPPMWLPDALAKKPHDLGAPLRNRTVDLLLTMDRCRVLRVQVERLTSENTSTDQHPQALDRLSRAPFATQSATHFDLVSEELTAAEMSLRKRIRAEADKLITASVSEVLLQLVYRRPLRRAS
jgi:hypothetical protein